MVKRVGVLSAIGTVVIPRRQDARPETPFCNSLGLKLGLVDQVIEGHQ
jgi:hypothetical protein